MIIDYKYKHKLLFLQKLLFSIKNYLVEIVGFRWGCKV